MDAQTSNQIRFYYSREPSEYGFIESFNGRLRDECLNTEIFSTLEEAEFKISSWKKDYNCVRPHISLKDQTPDKVWQLFQQDLARRQIMT